MNELIAWAVWVIRLDLRVPFVTLGVSQSSDATRAFAAFLTFDVERGALSFPHSLNDFFRAYHPRWRGQQSLEG
jgi:hypothetical protein